MFPWFSQGKGDIRLLAAGVTHAGGRSEWAQPSKSGEWTSRKGTRWARGETTATDYRCDAECAEKGDVNCEEPMRLTRRQAGAQQAARLTCHSGARDPAKHFVR
jgi:hypothetical protein